MEPHAGAWNRLEPRGAARSHLQAHRAAWSCVEVHGAALRYRDVQGMFRAQMSPGTPAELDGLGLRTASRCSQGV